ncbi:MAG: hypothetical protein GY856_14935 [bacterium]|nr:hypothetical protein [bacterium]
MSELSNRRAVVIGINKYLHGNPRLRTAVPDARAVTQALKGDHDYVDPIELTDEAATLARITDLLEQELPALVTKDTGLVFYFAGHGYAEKSDGRPQGYVFPQDARPKEPESWLSMDALREALVRLHCRHLLLVLDCCFAGRIRWATTRRTVIPRPWLYESQYARFLEGDAWQILTSASHEELARDVGATNHSPFAAAFLEGLAGKADWGREGRGGDGVITATELYLHIYDELRPAREERFQTPGLWSLKPEDTGEYVFLNPVRQKILRPDPKLDEANNPWLGLDTYGEDHAELFSGREPVVRELLDRLLDDSEPPLLAVVGASGCGKSSLVKAGLLPLLNEPPAELAQKVGEWAVDGGLRLRGDPRRKLAAAKRRLVRAKGRRKLLFIDQFEELFTHCPNPTAQAGFLKDLSQLAAGDEPVRVLLTLRSDFEPRLKASQELGDLLTDGRHELSARLKTEELREVVEKPATLKALFFESAELVDELVDEAIATPGALPLLSLALAETYGHALRRRDQSWDAPDRFLKRQDCGAVGGVKGTVHALARKLLDKADEPRQKTVRRMMLRMVSFEGWTVSRRRTSRRELDYPGKKEQDRVKEMLGRLIEKRLVVADQDHLELAHDALLATGSPMADWLEGVRETQLLLREIWRAAVEWDEREGAEGLLWDEDPRLPLVRKMSGELNQLESKFLRASIRRQRSEAEKARKAADARRVAVAGMLNLVDPTQAALVLLEVENPGRTPGAGSRMLEALVQPLAHSILRGHEDAVVDAAFDAAGTRVLTASRDGTARVWPAGDPDDRSPGKPLIFRGQGDELLSAAFNPDGSTVLTVGGDGSARLWNVADPEQAIVLGHRKVTSAAFNAERGKLLTVGNDTVRVWNGDGSGEPAVLGNDQEGWLVVSAAFNTAGTRVLIFSDDQAVRTWTPRSRPAGRPERWVPREPIVFPHDVPVVGAAFNAAGTRVLTLCADYAVRVWNVERATGNGIVLQHDDWVSSGAFSADGTRVVTTSYDGTARVWNVAGPDAVEIAVLRHQAWVSSAALSADGTRVVTVSHDGTAQLWDANAPGSPAVLRGHRARVLSAAFSADGTQVVTTSGDRTARLWRVSGPDGRNPAMPVVLRGHEGSVESVAFTADGTRLLTASADGTARIWSLGGRTPGSSVVLDGHTGPVRMARFDAAGTKVVTASDDRTARLWDVGVPSRSIVLGEHTGPVSTAELDAAGTQVVTASDDGTARVWNVPDGRTPGRPMVLKGHTDLVRSAAFNAAGTQVVTASDDRTARIWEVAGAAGRVREAKVVLDGHTHMVWGAAFNATGTKVVTASLDGTARVYDADGSGEVVLAHETATLPGLFNKEVLSAAFNDEGTRVVTACTDGAVRVWNVTGPVDRLPGKPLVLRGHLYEVAGAAFNADGTRVLSASYDGTARVWTLDGSQEPVVLRHHDEKSYLIAALNPAGTQVVTASSEGAAYVWTIDAGRLQAVIRATTSASLDPELRALYLGESPVPA